MVKNKKRKAKKKYIEALLIPLFKKNLILLRGSKGYVMCGYLNLRVAEKFKDVAVKIVGVKTINDALRAKVHSCTDSAKRLGIRKGQPVKEVLKLLA